MKFITAFLTLVCLSISALSRNYFVSPTGNNSNSGRSPAAPFKTLQWAADKTAPGDTVFVMNGTYTNTSNSSNVLNIFNSGTASRWIVYMNYPTHNPVIQLSNNWSGIQVQGADYIVIDGFTVVGNNDNITLSYALSQTNNLNNPATSGNGIGAAPQYQNATNLPHHLTVRNCNISKCGGGGIYTTKADYLTFTNNRVYECAWYSPYGNSGISLYQNWNSDGGTGIKNYITNNIVYRNEEYIPFYAQGYITDGNGIIVDDSRNTQNNSPLGNYVGKTYIANNVVFDNGGRGIHVYSSDKVIVANNTCYQNCKSPSVPDGEYTAYEADSIWFINNIGVPKSGIKPINTSSSTTTHLVVNYNVWGNNASLAQPLGLNTLTSMPLFSNATTNAALANFRLQNGSVGIDDGTTSFAPATDLDGIVRPGGSGIDRGVYERSTSPSASVTPAGPIAWCVNQFPVTLTAITNTPGATFFWKKDGVPLNPSQTTASVIVSQSGNYSVVVTKNGFSTESVATIVTVYPIITTTLDTTVCTSFAWNGSTYTVSGTYTRTLLSSLGCDSVATLRLRVSKPVVNTSKTDALCYGTATGSITASASGGIAPYSYRLGASGSYAAASTFGSLRASTSYKVYAIDSLGCTAVSNTVVVSQWPAITASFSKTDVLCNGAYTGSITVSNPDNGVAPYRYQIGTLPSQTSPTFTGLRAILQRVTVIDARGCSTTNNIYITQPAAITASFNIVPPVCNGTATGSITVSPANGTPPYQYQLGSNTGAFSSSNVLTGVKGGTSIIYIRDTIGCVSRVIASVPQPAAITVGASQVNPTCSTPLGSITLAKTGGPNNPPYQYSLNTRPTYVSNNFFDSLKAGSHVGYLLDALGCVARTGVISLPKPINCFVAGKALQSTVSDEAVAGLSARLINNASQTAFTLLLRSSNSNWAELTVTNADGKMMVRKNVAPQATYVMGNEWLAGLYYITIRRGKQAVTLKALKL